MKYFKYLNYLLRHKWFVFVECCKVGIIWRGFWHDFSKFYPSEFIPYAKFFYGRGCPKEYKKMKCDGMKCNAISVNMPTGCRKFDNAWLSHQRRNPHHWQYWILREDKEIIKKLPMPINYAKEMICDWKGAGKAQKNPLSTKEWYNANKEKIKLADSTRNWVEENL